MACKSTRVFVITGALAVILGALAVLMVYLGDELGLTGSENGMGEVQYLLLIYISGLLMALVLLYVVLLFVIRRKESHYMFKYRDRRTKGEYMSDKYGHRYIMILGVLGLISGAVILGLVRMHRVPYLSAVIINKASEEAGAIHATISAYVFAGLAGWLILYIFAIAVSRPKKPALELRSTGPVQRSIIELEESAWTAKQNAPPPPAPPPATRGEEREEVDIEVLKPEGEDASKEEQIHPGMEALDEEGVSPSAQKGEENITEEGEDYIKEEGEDYIKEEGEENITEEGEDRDLQGKDGAGVEGKTEGGKTDLAEGEEDVDEIFDLDVEEEKKSFEEEMEDLFEKKK